MMKFSNKQDILEIGGTGFGGQPGKRKTVLVGSLFYPGHTMVEDRVKGKCKPGSVEAALHRFESASEETGVPGGVMAYAETNEAMSSYLHQVADLTDLPIFIDSPSWNVRIAGCEEANAAGLHDRVVYNTINAGANLKELEAISEVGVEAAVLLAFNPMDITLKGKVYLLDNGGGLLDKGMIDTAKGAGVRKILFDSAVMASEQNAGVALRAITLFKAKWGLPSGCALHNAVESFAPLSKLQGEDRKIYRYVDIASVVMPMMAGADFVMFGPIEYARRAMHAAAFADEMIAQSVADI
ncbi:MAG: tetrahydromethanopterin S-methyltransferase subunit H [Methanomassiliicoccales archaeon]|jgi:tetrahydromethanopterin S-methyltransferase subunit H